jgi:hypothetical protein
VADDVAAIVDGDVDLGAGIHGRALPDAVCVLLQAWLLAWPSVKLFAPGNGAFLSASAFGAGIGDVVEVCASAPKAVVEAIKEAMRSFFMVILRRFAIVRPDVVSTGTPGREFRK